MKVCGMRKIRITAPGKLMLLGEYAALHDRPCLVAAIDKSLMIEVTEVNSRSTDESNFVKAVIDQFNQQYGKINVLVKTISTFGSEYGLGSSAAVTVALAIALFKLKKIKVANKELFDFCYQVVQQVQGVGSGFDLAAAIYKGVIYFVTGGEKIERLAAKELSLVVGYSGVKADTMAMIKKTAKKINSEFLDQSAQLVNQARIELVQKNWPELGKLMNQNQAILRKLGVSTPKLDKMIQVSLKAGAWGAKLSGAGGGDCMIALVSNSKKLAVEKAVAKAGGVIIRVKLTL